MKLTVLVDNYTFIDKYFYGEPGLSFYIEDGSDKILFDCGYSNLFKSNAEKMGIDLSKVTKVVFSHGHDDHTGGLSELVKIINDGTEFVAHTDTFNEKKEKDKQTGSLVRAEKLAERFSMKLSNEPQKVSDNITLLGEIPMLNNFEKRKQFGFVSSENGFVPDFVFEDSALVYESESGIYVITGCSHAGICNIIEYAVSIFKKPVLGVIGGFHLKNVDERVYKTIEFFKEYNIKNIYPSHCTSFEVKSAINDEIKIGVAGVGLKLEWL